MESFNSGAGPVTKLIAVGDAETGRVLRGVLESCGYETAGSPDFSGRPSYLVLPADQAEGLDGQVFPAVLVLERDRPGGGAEKFARCVMDYDLPVESGKIPAEKILTYSDKSDNADFTARNIRTVGDGVVFEIVGIGIIGRVKLPDPGRIKSCLMAASAAISCGIPFADVLGGLNRIQAAG